MIVDGGFVILSDIFIDPPWSQVRPVWQLTVVPFRVFYDVDEGAAEVIVNAVRRKPPGATTKEIL